ncbi:hypothetical protein A2U01_0074737, partial [Trifolium medium]|nr:hypothetical protein [Trifolium medium]
WHISAVDDHGISLPPTHGCIFILFLLHTAAYLHCIIFHCGVSPLPHNAVYLNISPP